MNAEEPQPDRLPNNIHSLEFYIISLGIQRVGWGLGLSLIRFSRLHSFPQHFSA